LQTVISATRGKNSPWGLQLYRPKEVTFELRPEWQEEVSPVQNLQAELSCRDLWPKTSRGNMPGVFSGSSGKT
jgi:hypothetical protein